MGRKRTGKGKYLLLCVASLIAFSLAGCAGVREMFATRHYSEPPEEVRKSEGPSVEGADEAKAEAPAIGEPAEGPPVQPAKDAVQKIATCEQQADVAPLGEACRHLLLGNKLLAERDFKGALRENQTALSLADNGPPGDQALFNLGLIYAHYDNPEKDYKKSIEYFKQLVAVYPRSSFREQAKIWVGVLDVIEKSKQVDIEIEMKKKELGR